MREIKFKCWDITNKIMVDAISAGMFAEVSPEDGDDEGNKNYELQTKLYEDGSGKIEGYLMQYTGLKDKNGKEKYFDDIVKITWRKDTDSYLQQGDDHIEKEFIARIDWNVDRIVYRLANGKILSFPSNAKFEVIGNIYENPELLK